MAPFDATAGEFPRVLGADDTCLLDGADARMPRGERMLIPSEGVPPEAPIVLPSLALCDTRGGPVAPFAGFCT